MQGMTRNKNQQQLENEMNWNRTIQFFDERNAIWAETKSVRTKYLSNLHEYFVISP